MHPEVRKALDVRIVEVERVLYDNVPTTFHEYALNAARLTEAELNDEDLENDPRQELYYGTLQMLTTRVLAEVLTRGRHFPKDAHTVVSDYRGAVEFGTDLTKCSFGCVDTCVHVTNLAPRPRVDEDGRELYDMNDFKESIGKVIRFRYEDRPGHLVSVRGFISEVSTTYVMLSVAEINGNMQQHPLRASYSSIDSGSLTWE